jgi:hypothetical protein
VLFSFSSHPSKIISISGVFLRRLLVPGIGSAIESVELGINAVDKAGEIFEVSYISNIQ